MSRPRRDKVPEVIYLQWYACDQKDLAVLLDDESIDADWETRTWCEDRIYDTDIAYRRVRKGDVHE